jgi:hypothetical protein
METAEGLRSRPGAVVPLFDRAPLEGAAWVHVQPLTKTRTTAIRAPELLAFLRGLGRDPRVIDLP